MASNNRISNLMDLERQIRELRYELDNLQRQLRVTLPAETPIPGKVLVSGGIEPYWADMAITKDQVEAVLTGEIDSHSHIGAGAISEPALTALLDDNYAPLSHSHGDLYYTEGETDALLSAKAEASHGHSASDISAGTLNDARVASSNVLQHQGSLSLTESQISDLGSYITGIDKADVEAVLTGEITSHSHAGGGSSFDSAPGVMMEVATTAITNADTTVLLATEVADPSGNYSLALNEVTITDGGWMFLSYSIPVNDGGSAGGTRARVYAWVEMDTGSGYSVIAQSRAQDYAREASGGEGLSSGFVANIPDSAKVRLRIRQSGTTALSTETGETQMSMFKLST